MNKEPLYPTVKRTPMAVGLCMPPGLHPWPWGALTGAQTVASHSGEVKTLDPHRVCLALVLLSWNPTFQ